MIDDLQKIRQGDSASPVPRAANERQILHLIRRLGPRPKAELSRLTGLSAQGVSVIVNRLIEAGLLLKQPKVRGKVGQPSTPIALNPKGAYAIGVKVGRRGVDVTCIDLVGVVIDRRRVLFDTPDRSTVMGAIDRTVGACLGGLSAGVRGRLTGIGIAAPDDLEAWCRTLGLPDAVCAEWRNIDLRAEISSATKIDTLLANDAVAACAAELVIGSTTMARNTLYLFLGSFIGGGTVVDGRLLAGAPLHALPMEGALEDGAALVQLSAQTSLVVLEQALADAGHTLDALGRKDVPAEASAAFDAWLATAARALSYTIQSACCVLRFEQVVLDGALGAEQIERLLDVVGRDLDRRMDGRAPKLKLGSLGSDARAIGGALLPLHAAFAPSSSEIADLGAG